MKKAGKYVITLLLLLGLAGCGTGQPAPTATTAEEPSSTGEAAKESTTVTLWTYPVGDWTDSAMVSDLIADFNRKYPDYRVTVEYLDYADGDAKIEEAIEKNELPDLVLEGPERLVADWGDRGLMADLSDLMDSEAAQKISEPVRAACKHQNGAYYEFPFFMSAHCMAINYEMFADAGALSYIDEETRTWSTDDFIHAVEALQKNGQKDVGIIYCKNQVGDQGTRALINNLYGGTYANPEHTAYTFNSKENIQALQLLQDLDGIRFAPESQGTDEIAEFAQGKLAMAFCWNVALEISQTASNPDISFDIFPMAFPTATGEPTLQGGIWGFGVFDNGDDARIEAARKFIEFLFTDDAEYSKAVLTSTYWPVREMADIYANDELMSEYSLFTNYMGDYYQVTPGWGEVRTLWWNMLQQIGSGEDIETAAREFEDAANQAAEKAQNTP